MIDFVVTVVAGALFTIALFFAVQKRNVPMAALAALVLGGTIWGLFWRPEVKSHPPAAIRNSMVAFPGEWITRERDNSKVCQLQGGASRLMTLADLVHTCGGWTETPPTFGESIRSRPQWLRCGSDGCKVHFADGWRG